MYMYVCMYVSLHRSFITHSIINMKHNKYLHILGWIIVSMTLHHRFRLQYNDKTHTYVIFFFLFLVYLFINSKSLSFLIVYVFFIFPFYAFRYNIISTIIYCFSFICTYVCLMFYNMLSDVLSE